MGFLVTLGSRGFLRRKIGKFKDYYPVKWWLDLWITSVSEPDN